MIEPALLERTILEVLGDQPSNLMLPQPTLHNEAMARLGRGISKAEFEARLAGLRTQHQVIGITGQDYTRWKIAPSGLARLTELHPL